MTSFRGQASWAKNDVMQGEKNDVMQGEANSPGEPPDQKSKQSRVTNLSPDKHCPIVVAPGKPFQPCLT